MRSRARIVEFASIATAAAVIGASALTVETVEMEILPDQQLDAVQKFEKKFQTQVVEEIVEVEKEVPRKLAMPSHSLLALRLSLTLPDGSNLAGLGATLGGEVLGGRGAQRVGAAARLCQQRRGLTWLR